jgi:hypothetical protein
VNSLLTGCYCDFRSILIEDTGDKALIFSHCLVLLQVARGASI